MKSRNKLRLKLNQQREISQFKQQKLLKDTTFDSSTTVTLPPLSKQSSAQTLPPLKLLPKYESTSRLKLAFDLPAEAAKNPTELAAEKISIVLP